MKVPVYGNITIMPGTDASFVVSEGLLGAAPCDDSTNAAVELKSDGKTFYACLNETNEAQMGTWLINTDRTILTLNISNPQPFALTISDLTITANSFSGTVENFPLPIDANFELGANLPGGGVNYQTSSIDLAFTKVP
jgi:P pilus assembly chaperone PapD